MTALLSRRTLLAAALGGVAACLPVQAATRRIEPTQMRRIEPRLTAEFRHSAALREAVARSAQKQRLPRASRRSRPATTQKAPLHPPAAYVRTAARHGIPAWVLYGVALQESQLKFGKRTLPYPWTLCVRGRGLRFGSYASTVAALKRLVAAGVTNIDCGAMQVNWRWHGDKLRTAENALEPYANLDIGARILRQCFEARRNWRKAVADYHTGGNPSARARGERYMRQTFARLARMGVPLKGALA